MSTEATGYFEFKSWNEQPFSEIEGVGKLARASVTNTFHGDIEGEATLEYLMAYRDDNYASFVGLERIIGSINGRAGSFVLQHSGTYENRTVTARWFVVPDSGTSNLIGLRREGGFVAQLGEHQTPYKLAYHLE